MSLETENSSSRDTPSFIAPSPSLLSTMSRNPYLAASRPTSSFTRSSRSSKRNDPLSSSKSSLIGRSRSSASLGGFMSSYTPASSYTPSLSSTWQRPLSSSRVSRLATDPSTNATSSALSNRANEYTPSSQSSRFKEEPSEESRSSLYRSASTHDLTPSGSADRDDDDNDNDTSHVLSPLPIFRCYKLPFSYLQITNHQLHSISFHPN